MKTMSALILLLALVAGCRQSHNKTSSKVNPADVNHPWFKVGKINEITWRISDYDEDNIYLIEGTDSALLVDNGIGAVNLIDFVKRITPLPLIVINTHGHPDHVGSNNQFEKVYAHPDDLEAIKYFTDRQVQQELLQHMVQSPIPDSIKFNGPDTLQVAKLVPVSDGYVFDLGNRKIEVIHVPGHTPGSICLLDSENKLLFAGDHIKQLVWVHMEESLPMEDYLNSLKKLKARETEFEILLPGHHNPLDVKFLVELINCAENIISGNCQSQPYESVVGKGMVCEFKKAKIAYNPARIKSTSK